MQSFMVVTWLIPVIRKSSFFLIFEEKPLIFFDRSESVGRKKGTFTNCLIDYIVTLWLLDISFKTW